MVMKKNIMRKNLYRSIQRSFTRYIAIVAIIALGAGLFVGLLATKTDMIATGQAFLDGQNMYDLRLMNSYGWTDVQLEAVRDLEGVVDAEGLLYLDVIGTTGSKDMFSAQGSGEDEGVYQLYALPESVDMPYLLGGRMPQADNECLADGHFANDSILGATFYVSSNNDQETLDRLTVTEFTVVGYVSTPLFLDMTRGTTALGDGSISSYLYVPQTAFSMDYYPEIHVTIPGDYEIYTDVYNDAMELAGEQLKPLLQPLAQDRYVQLRQDSQQAYDDGMKTYEEGLQEYLDGKAAAEQELADAEKKLQNGQMEIQKNEALLKDGKAQIADGWEQIKASEQTLAQSQQTLDSTKSQTLAPLQQQKQELDARYQQLQPELIPLRKSVADLQKQIQPINLQIEPLETRLRQVQAELLRLNTSLVSLDAGIAVLENALQSPWISQENRIELEQRLQEQKNQRQTAAEERDAASAEEAALNAQLAPLYEKRQPLQEQLNTLQLQLAPLEATASAIESAYDTLDALYAQAEKEFADAQAQIDAGAVQLQAAREELTAKEKELQAGQDALLAAKAQLAEGIAEYESAKIEAQQEFLKAEQELAEAKQTLDDAKAFLDSMSEPDVYVLDRNTNVGYLALDSNSDIVAGVSRVFPVFFLLVAALVCITTMTRMVEEERTQIGTLKALGYSNGAIIRKYLLYAGSAAIVGCGFGVFAGSVVFPNILWTAYSLIINIRPQINIVFDIPLCLSVTAAYTVVICLVTWYCCRMSLREVPAELIRPKPPTTGKKILLEHVPFWEKISFLNKVMIRNIFRYRQRLLMMLVGIGGCTALLMTGFGIGDSIMDIVSIQFEEVTLYDIQVQFAEGRTEEEMKMFRQESGANVSTVAFAHQSGVELDFGDGTKSIYMIVPQGSIADCFDLHNAGADLQLPGAGEAILSTGTAEAMGIQTGDTVRIRNSDMQIMELTVSGIFENYVYNYVLVDRSTVAEQWGSEPEYQLAYVNVVDGVDPHAVSAELSEMDGVMAVMVNQDLADQVGSMLQAMNLVVATVVVCAALLAVIVLYNLTNINITERLREIATIKVLGFTSAESAAYVFKENLILSVMGAGLGLLGGKFLLDFVMSQIKIDMVWFQARLLPMSLVWSVVITLLMAVLVDFVLYFKLERINMAEALKPVE